MFLKVFALFMGISLLSSVVTFGYWKDYPPYKFKDGPRAHLNIKPLVSGKGDYKSKDASVVIHLKEPRPFEVEIFLKVGKTGLVSSDQGVEGFPSSVYQADLDDNGHDDFIVLYSYRGPGLSMHLNRVEIFLKKSKGGFEKISYDTFDAGIEDFIGPDKDGKYNIVMTGFYEGKRHNYFSYNIYEFKNYRLVNTDAKARGFPKFVQYTFKNNDQDTGLLTKKERLQHTKVMDNSIHYEAIR